MKTQKARSGFTLIEILIVLGIIVAVAAVFVPVVLNLSERNQVPKAASLLENALSMAKAKAVAERRPNGIRLIAQEASRRQMTSGVSFAWYDQIQSIEDPGDYTDAWLWGLAGNAAEVTMQPYWSTGPGVGSATPSQGVLPWGLAPVTIRPGPFSLTNAVVDSGNSLQTIAVPRNRCLFGPISIIGAANLWTSDAATTFRSQRLNYNYSNNNPRVILPGDKIEVNGVGELFTVVAVSTTNLDIGTNPAYRIFVPTIVVDRDITVNIVHPQNGRSNYRAIRKPRIVAGTQTLKLPQDVVIDVTPSRQVNLGISDLDTSGSFFMTGVSSLILTNGITNLTVAPSPPLVNVAPPFIDIMFSPSGELLPVSQDFGNRLSVASTQVSSFSTGISGILALWLHSRGDPNLWAARQATAAQGNADNQALVSINARTGFIGSYPVNVQPTPATADPLLFVRTGKGRISADTGQ